MTTKMNPALAAAVKLHDFIRSNAGETADWPLRITANDPGLLARLDELLRDFRSAVVEANKHET